MMKCLPSLALLFGLCFFAGRTAAQNPSPPNVPPIRIIADFFVLTAPQLDEIKGLLETRRAAVEPLAKQIDAKEKELGELIRSSNPDASTLGSLMIEIHGLREQLNRAHKEFIVGFEGVLTDEQKNKLNAVRRAARLDPVIHAMRELRFF